MSARVILLLSVMLLPVGCGGEKHLPSSNPPEYDPNKVSTAPVAPLRPAALSTPPTELERLRSKLDSLRTNQNAKGEGKKIPLDPALLQLFNGATNPCEALSRLAPGLSNTQIFAGAEGAALKKALGPDADGIARRMDEHLEEGLKHSLSSGAANCAISVRPQQKSGRSQPPHLVLAHRTSTQPFVLAQTTIPDASQDDYDVQKSVRKEPPLPDWVGWKSTETMTRIGKKPHTEGIREYYEMVIAPKAKRCPDPAGIVEGTVEWSLVMYRATTGPAGEPYGVLYRQLVQATLKGEVDEDAKVKHVDFDVTVTLQHIGTELAHSSHAYGSRGRFTLDQRQKGLPQELKIITVSGFSENEAQIKDAHLLGSLTALMAYYAGQEYFNAQAEWNKPNTCVEIRFTPATKTKKFSPNESVSVKTELRTKKEQTVVPAKFKEAKEKPREGNGTVSPKQAESALGSPATFTYTMPEKRVKRSGFWVGAVSRAGVAQALDGEWEVADGGMRLRITNRIWMDPGSPYALGGHAQFDGTVQFEILLQPHPHIEGSFHGEINVVRPMIVRHVRPAAHPCSGSGSRTEHWLMTAHVDPKSESMTVDLFFTPLNEHASWTCTGPAGTWTDELEVDLPGSFEPLHMPTKTGTKKDVSVQNLPFLEKLRVEVAEGIGDQAGAR